MVRHYFTLFCLAEELRGLRGMRLAECYTQAKNALTLVLEGAEQECILECSIDPQTGGMFARRGYNRARKNTFDVFGTLPGLKLSGVALPENERVLALEFGANILHVQFFGGGKGNIILCRTDGQVLDAFKAARELKGSSYIPEARPAKSLADMPPAMALRKALTHSLLLIGKAYQDELARRLGIDIEQNVESFGTDELTRIEAAVYALRSECLSAQSFHLYRDEEGKLLLSLLELPVLGTAERTFTRISEALRARLIGALREERFAKEYEQSRKALEKHHRKILRAFRHLDEEKTGAERALTRQLYGEILLARPDVHSKGRDSLETLDWEGQEILIPLDPSLSLLENAHSFFAKARNARQAQEIRERRYLEHVGKLEQVEKALTAFTSVQDEDTLKSFRNQFPEFAGTMQSHSDATQAAGSRYRSFDLGENYTLYVGRNSAQNDELTLRFAKANDYWFHARGVSGSHCVLKAPDSQKPPKYILQAAAAISAYYSKARNAGLTPVVYTQKKYVRKRKGSPAGQVTLEREDVIMVRPGLPDSAAEQD